MPERNFPPVAATGATAAPPPFPGNRHLPGRSAHPAPVAGARAGLYRFPAHDRPPERGLHPGAAMGAAAAPPPVPGPPHASGRSLHPAAAPSIPGPGHPLILFPPEPVAAAPGHPPQHFIWRRQGFTTRRAMGPERLAPDWWRDDPAWRSGLRDYWRIDTAEGPRLWLFHTPQTAGWHAAGEFA